jgi:predicted lipoprotein with Yx(FWY)xxD motif
MSHLAAAMGLALVFSTAAFAQAMPEGVKLSSGMLTDAKGMTLYTFDNDKTPGQSSCSGNCLRNWPALVAAADAKPMGDWTVISRDDGSKQWAYKGKPLYTFIKDAKAGDNTGDNVGNVWHTAR